MTYFSVPAEENVGLRDLKSAYFWNKNMWYFVDLRYFEKFLGHLDIFWEFPERYLGDFTWYLCISLRQTLQCVNGNL